MGAGEGSGEEGMRQGQRTEGGGWGASGGHRGS